MTLYMRDLEKIEEGIEKGKEEGIKLSVIALLKKGLKPEDAAFYLDQPLAKILEIQAALSKE